MEIIMTTLPTWRRRHENKAHNYGVPIFQSKKLSSITAFELLGLKGLWFN